MELTKTIEQELASYEPKLTKERVLTILSTFLFALSLAFGVLKMFDPNYISSQAILIIIESIMGIFFSLIPAIVLKFCRVKIAFVIMLIINLFMIFAIIFGEIFLLYYRTGWWDSALHAFSGFGIAYSAFCLFWLLTGETNIIAKTTEVSPICTDVKLKHRFALCIIAAICLSLAVGLLWESVEFAIDLGFGTNMQKFMPESEVLFNGGLTQQDILGTDEQIVSFFRTPAGYKYALIDTMSDIVYCLVGVAIFTIQCVLLSRKSTSLMTTAFTKVK